MGNQNSSIQHAQKYMLVWHITAPPVICETSYTSADFHSLVDPPDEKILYWFLHLIVSPHSESNINNVKLQVNTWDGTYFGNNIATTQSIYMLDKDCVLQHVLQHDKISRVKSVMLQKCTFVVELDFPCVFPPLVPAIWISGHTMVQRPNNFQRMQLTGRGLFIPVQVNEKNCKVTIDPSVYLLKIHLESIPRLWGIYLHFDGCSSFQPYIQISHAGDFEHKCNTHITHRYISDITTYNFISFDKMNSANVEKISSAIMKGVPNPIQHKKDLEVKTGTNRFQDPPPYESVSINRNYVQNSELLPLALLTKNKMYYKLFIEKKFCDITIRTRDSMIRAHKVFLAADSTVWSKIFLENDTLETLSIDDMDSKTVLAVLEFIYTGSEATSLEITDEQLLVAADKYGIDGLKEQCVALLSRTISMQTAANLLILAHQNNAPNLLNNVLSFVRDNFDEFKKLKEFDSLFLKHPELGLMILKI